MQTKTHLVLISSESQSQREREREREREAEKEREVVVAHNITCKLHPLNYAMREMGP